MAGDGSSTSGWISGALMAGGRGIFDSGEVMVGAKIGGVGEEAREVREPRVRWI